MPHNEWPEVMGRWLKHNRFDEYFGCGVSKAILGVKKWPINNVCIHGRKYQSQVPHMVWPEVVVRWLKTKISMSILTVVW